MLESELKRCRFAKSLQILNPKSKVNPMPCTFTNMFCSVNNLSNLSDTYLHLVIRVCSKTKDGTVTFMNIECLLVSKHYDDGKGNENVPSYQNECAFFFSSSN